MDLRKILKNKPFQFSNKPTDFLQNPNQDADIIPFFLIDRIPDTSTPYQTLSEVPTHILNSIKGVSFFATIKALEEDKEDVGNVRWFLNRLRIPGTSIISDANPDVQRVIVALLHGMHAFFAASDKTAPPLTSTLPTRFNYVLNTYDTKKSTNIAVFDRIFSIFKRQYLNQSEKQDNISINSLIQQLNQPSNFIKNSFIRQKTGAKPIPIEEHGIPDTATVRDFYVHKIPLINNILIA